MAKFLNWSVSVSVMELLYIGVLGGLGCISRYLVTLWSQLMFGRGFPHGTLLVNFSGSLLLGLLLSVGIRSFPISTELRLGLSIGFLGGFTTFSTFSYQTLLLLEEGSYWSAGVNVFLNLSLCLLGAFVGVIIGRQFAG